MKKIICNNGVGGYGWSADGLREIAARKYGDDFVVKDGFSPAIIHNGERISGYEIAREDPDAIAALELLGSEVCSGHYSSLVVEEYDDDEFEFVGFDKYDGVETPRYIRKVDKNKVAQLIRAGDVDAMCEYIEYVRASTNVKNA